jgi:hypothetical protein
LFGSGLGATLPSAYTRSAQAPWSFELAYLQLLFDIGIVGTALVALPIVVAILCAARRLRTPGRSRDIHLLVGVGACAGLAIMCAGNPYLLSSVGMLTLAILLAMVETALPPGPRVQVSEAAGSPHGDVRRSWGAGPVTLSGRRLGGRAAFVLVAGVTAFLTVSEFARPRAQAPVAAVAPATAIALPSQRVATLRTPPRDHLLLARRP